MEDRQAREICLARNPRSGGEISWAVRLRPSSPRRSRDPARIHNETRTLGTHLSRKPSWPSTFITPPARLQRPLPLRYWSESKRREKPLQHPPGASHRTSPVRFDQYGANTHAVCSDHPGQLPASVRENGMPSNPAQRARAEHPAHMAGLAEPDAGARTLPPPRQAQRAGVKDRSRRAVTAMTARGAAREPGGAGRRHATLLRHSHRIKNSRVIPVDFFLMQQDWSLGGVFHLGMSANTPQPRYSRV